VRNLPDKLPKEDLKRNLYMLFATYGVILDIIALKTAKMRGQAHVVFRDIDSATQAMRALDNFTFFGKDMVRRASSFLLQASETNTGSQYPTLKANRTRSPNSLAPLKNPRTSQSRKPKQRKQARLGAPLVLRLQRRYPSTRQRGRKAPSGNKKTRTRAVRMTMPRCRCRRATRTSRLWALRYLQK
jgi:RNA recognition motif-containing protein